MTFYREKGVAMTRQQIRDTLYKMGLVFPFGRMTNDELELATGVWLEDFAQVSHADFLQAFRIYRASYSTFPTPADIKRSYRELIEDRRRKQPALPTPALDIEEQREINRRGLAKMRAALAGGKGGLKV